MSEPERPADPLHASVTTPGVHRMESAALLPTVIADFASAGWSTALVDLSAAEDKAAILDAFARALAFPAWVGRNWDALDDAMGDLSWWPPGPRGRLVAVVGTDRQTVGTAPDRVVTLDILDSATTRQATTSNPLIVLLVP